MTTVTVRHFTDPGCPFAFSAEPRMRRLEWLYGDSLTWETRMVVLSDSPEDYVEKGLTPEKLSSSYRSMFGKYGMPLDWSLRDRMHATAPACRAVLAARLHTPASEARLLRRLRVLTMGDNGLLDEPELHRRAAAEAGLDADALLGWMGGSDVEEALGADRAATRSPSAAARALDHKLGGPADERRYTCPSLEFELDRGGASVAVPGFQPLESYEAAIANLAPDLVRRADPSGVGEVLGWAPFPLATAEVAAVCDTDATDVRRELAHSGATFQPVGGDGYWVAA